MNAFEQIWLFCFGLSVGLGIWSIHTHSVWGGVGVLFVFSVFTKVVREL